MKLLELSVTRAARELKVDRNELADKVAVAAIKPSSVKVVRGQKVEHYWLRDLARVAFGHGTEMSARDRRESAQAVKIERENALAAGELLYAHDVESAFNQHVEQGRRQMEAVAAEHPELESLVRDLAEHLARLPVVLVPSVAVSQKANGHRVG